MDLKEPDKKNQNPGVRILHSHELFTGNREILIEHKNEFYRLMITKAGKLILNK